MENPIIDPLPMRHDSQNRVYYIEAVGADLIKIGHTGNIDSRLTALLTASAMPLRLLGTERGGPIREAELHRLLAEHRSHGEWFRRCPLLDALIDAADKPKEAPLWFAKTKGGQLRGFMRELHAGRMIRPGTGTASRARMPAATRLLDARRSPTQETT